MSRHKILWIRQYNTFRLQSLLLPKKQPKKPIQYEVEETPSTNQEQLKELESMWGEISKSIYTSNLNRYNCFLLFRYKGNSPNSSVDENNPSRLFNTLRNNYKHSVLIDTGSFDRTKFDACFNEPIIPENTKNSLLLAHFLKVQKPSVLSKIMSIAEKRDYSPVLVGVKASQKSTLIPLKELKPLLQEFSTMYEDFTYDNLMEMATNKHGTSHGTLRYLLKTLAKFGITSPRITQDSNNVEHSWFIITK